MIGLFCDWESLTYFFITIYVNFYNLSEDVSILQKILKHKYIFDLLRSDSFPLGNSSSLLNFDQEPRKCFSCCYFCTHKLAHFSAYFFTAPIEVAQFGSTNGVFFVEFLKISRLHIATDLIQQIPKLLALFKNIP